LVPDKENEPLVDENSSEREWEKDSDTESSMEIEEDREWL